MHTAPYAYELYAEDMYDTYAYRYFEYIYRSKDVVMQSSSFDYIT